MVGVERVPVAVTLGFVREQIEKNRLRLPADLQGALTFGVVGDDGLTRWWSLYVTPKSVTVEKGAVPLEWEGKLVTLYTNEDQLSAITRGDLVKGVDVEGDTELLKILARCFDGGANVHQIRVDQ